MDNTLETKHRTRTNFILASATGIVLGCSYPPFPLGVLACVALVPLLLLIERLGSFRRQFGYTYLSFFIAGCIALYWVGGFVHGKDPYLMIAGGALLLWQPLVMSLSIVVYLFVRTSFGLRMALFVLPFSWVAYEWLYAATELSFPWLALGNTQTYELSKIQFADIAGVAGVSFWILLINVLCFILLLQQIHKEWMVGPKRKLAVAVLIVMLYIAPSLYGVTINESRYANKPGSEKIKVGIVQPDVDPWEKWEGGVARRWQQVEHLLASTGNQKKDSVEISVWPETAILFDLPEFGEPYRMFREVIDSLNIAVLSGFVEIRYYPPEDAPVTSSVLQGTSMRYDSYNSVLYVQPHTEGVQTYAKMRLVPFAERIPWVEKVPFLLKPLKWGVGISNWGIGNDSTIFIDRLHHASFLGMICYESIFPEFVSTFVRKGAQFLVFITNDSWWGNTSGARQHNQFAIIRAIENRRWVVRCANGGISCFVDPLGRMYDKTEMFSAASLTRWIEPRSEQTFYTRHGDWLARISLATTGLLLALSLIKNFLMRK